MTNRLVGADFAEGLQRVLLQRVATGELQLPTLPRVAAQVEQLFRNTDVDIRKVTTIIESDPLLAAQVLKLANSAAFAKSQRVESLSKAVNSLGLRNVRNVLMTAVVYKIFTSRNVEINAALRTIWEHSVAVALLAQDVAGLAGSENSGIAYISGLLHDVGKPIVAAYLLEFEKSLLARKPPGKGFEGPEWSVLVEQIHRPVGIELAKRWSLPESVVSAVQGCDDYDAGNRLSVVNAVRFANALARKAGIDIGMIDQTDTQAMLMIGRSIMGLSEDVVERLSTEIQKRRLLLE